VTSSSQTPPLADEEAPLLNTYISRREQKSWSWISPGLETKNYCAGEAQQQFNRPSWVSTGPETKNDYAGEGQQQFTGLD
jgi:hypothetical protein